ncbi:hypothetical protein BC826DRAFT_1106558 [Russula brevipes]|nr:hypothetical protein BC826DRAFT_1106558 [Russula brevipes]
MVLTEDEQPSPMIVVDFIVFKTLPDPKPIIVRQVLRRGAELDEVLWNFSRFNDNRRITLQDNPHFYLELPTSVDAYTGEFRTLPLVECFFPSPIWVLSPSDIHGTLEGEAMVGESIRDTPNLGHYKEPFPMEFSASDLPTYRRGFPGIMTSPDDEDLYIYARREAPIPAQEMVLPPPPPTSERPDDILLTIFDHYRLDDEEDWNGRRRWCKLAQVCRKWRQVIYNSSSRLNIHIHFTLGARTLDMLAHLPPIPLVINYRDSSYIPYFHMRRRRRNFNLEDEDGHSGILHALQQYDRTRYIVLEVQSETLQKLIVPIYDADTSSRIPGPKSAPPRITPGFSSNRTTVSRSAPFLIILKLTNIQTSGYFSPEDLVTQLGHLLQLEELSIEFSIPLPDPDEEEELHRVPMTPTMLPSLRSLEFRGVCAYLEGLVVGFAPLGSKGFTSHYSTNPHSLSDTCPSLSMQLRESGSLRHRRICNQDMGHMAPSFSVTSRNELRVPDSLSPLALKFRCNQFDWQVYSMTEVCEALVPVLSVSELSLQYHRALVTQYPSFDEPHRSSDGQNALDSVMWHELLRPFNGVRRLGVSNHLAEELSCALDADDAEAAFAAFLNARQSVGRPVNLLPPPPPPPRVYLTPTPSESPVFPSPPSPRLSLPAQTSRR